VFRRLAVACSEPGLSLLDWPEVQLPADFLSQLSTELKDLLLTFGFETLGFGAPEAVLGTERRGGFPPDLALTHSSFHMLAIKSITASWAHFAICVHCLNWGHK
jgi:hypothetical protein